MKFFPHTNYFDALSPVLEEHEEEVFFQHPKYDFYCNQLGALYFKDEMKAQVRETGQYKILAPGDFRYISLGYKERIVLECYHGFTYKSFSIYHKDGNPYNYTQDNLVAFKAGDKENLKYKKERRDFIIQTIKYMNSREPFITKRNIEPIDYWEALQIPKWLMLEYKIYQGKPLPERTGEKKKYMKGDEQREVLKRIYDMKQAGNSWNVMMEELGIKSRAGFCYLLKKAEATFDI